MTLDPIARSMGRCLMIGGAALAIFIGIAGQASAQAIEFTPSDPANCTLEPYTADELEEILRSAAAATPAADDAGIDDVPVDATPFALPNGEPADDETIAAIEATMRQILDCGATGDFLLVLAGFSPEVVGELFLGAGAPEEDIADPVGELVDALTAGDPTPEAEDERSVLVGVREVTDLGDGRVGALVDTGDAGELSEATDLAEAVESDLTQTAYVVFENDGDRYVIVELVDDLGDQYPPTQ